MKYKLDTLLVHLKKLSVKGGGETSLPICQSTSFRYKSCEELKKVFNGESAGYVYTRISNPTLDLLERKLTILEDGLGAIVTSSGMAAIATGILTLAKSGHHIISSQSIFGGTYAFFDKTLRALGIETTFVDPTDIKGIKSAVKDNTKAVFIETIGNPKMDVPDIKAIAEIVRLNEIPLIVDSTVTTPYLLQAKKFGADIVIHSASKFINGHGNSIGGVVIDCGTFNWASKRFTHFKDYEVQYGILAFLAKARKEIFRDFGPCMAPHTAFLMDVGLETLALRMERHCSNAVSLAEFLTKHPKVSSVNYPGLKGNKFNKVAKEQFSNRYGALLTFCLKDKESCFKCIDSLKLASNLANLGDVKTLVIHPSSTICVEFNKQERKQMGVTDNLIRVSVGIENIDDIRADFKQALDKV